MAINDKYSYKAFPYHGVSFKTEPAADFNNSEIVGSGFYQEYLEGDATVTKDIFPVGMNGVTFINCNLDNVVVPAGNTVSGGTNKKINVQNDLEDWFVDGSGKPTEPLLKDLRTEAKISSLPADIPKTKWKTEQREKYQVILMQRTNNDLPALTPIMSSDNVLNETVRE